MARETWKSIALALGKAMVNHQYCEDHSASRPEPGCPFCDDRATYLRFRAFAEKNGCQFPDPLAGAQSVSIYDLKEWQWDSLTSSLTGPTSIRHTERSNSLG